MTHEATKTEPSRHASREIIGSEQRSMPSPDGLIHYRAVLVRHGNVATAYVGSITSHPGSAQQWANGWIANNGRPINYLAEVALYFPDIADKLARLGLRYEVGA